MVAVFLAKKATHIVAVVRHRLITCRLCHVEQAVAQVQSLPDLVAKSVAAIGHRNTAGNLVQAHLAIQVAEHQRAPIVVSVAGLEASPSRAVTFVVGITPA